MRLLNLNPEWIFKYNPATHGVRRADDLHSVAHHGTLDDETDVELQKIDLPAAQGVMFLCPTCFKKNAGPIGTEHIICWFKDRSVPAEAFPGPGRWVASGSGFEDLTLTPSVNVAHEHWHGFVKLGEVTP